MNGDARNAPVRPPGKSGWKVVRLIVAVVGAAVLFVLGVLALLLFPAWEKARRSACVGNLNQIAAAIESYVGDHGGRLPPTLETLTADGYLPDPSSLYCPSRTGSAKARVAALAILEGAGPRGLSAEETAAALRDGAPPHYVYVRYRTVEEMQDAPVLYDEAGNHKGGRHVLFGDWRTEWISEQDLRRRFAQEAQHAPAFKECMDAYGMDGAAP